VKKNIYDLSCNKFDTQIAVVENQGMFDSVQESSVRLYDVGRRRDDEDEGVSWNNILFHSKEETELYRVAHVIIPHLNFTRKL
jgi:hypothetical protein